MAREDPVGILAECTDHQRECQKYRIVLLDFFLHFVIIEKTFQFKPLMNNRALRIVWFIIQYDISAMPLLHGA